jgi:serine/threonine-protein kinase RsbW
MDFSISCAFSANPDGVASADDWIEKLAAQWGVDEKTAFNARLCVAELASNLVMHGGQTGCIRFTIVLSRNGGCASVDFYDDGSPFDPMSEGFSEPGQDDSPKIGGLGLHLVRSFSTRMIYTREPGQNHSRLDFFSEGTVL